MSARCICPGAVCSCGAEGIVKDGFGVRRSVMSMDGAVSGEKHGSTDAMMSDSERAYAEMKVRDANAWLSGEPSAITPDRVIDAGPEYAQGIRDGAYEAMIERDRNAWKGR